MKYRKFLSLFGFYFIGITLSEYIFFRDMFNNVQDRLTKNLLISLIFAIIFTFVINKLSKVIKK